MGAMQFKLFLDDYGQEFLPRIKTLFNRFTEFIGTKHWADLSYTLKSQSASDDKESPQDYKELLRLALKDPNRTNILDCPIKERLE